MILIFFYGGFIAAVVFLILASVFRSSPNAVRSLSLLAFFALIFQGGCTAVANNLGRATGGGVSIDAIVGIIAVAFLVACVWSFILGGQLVRDVGQRWQTRERESSPRSVHTWLEPALLVTACMLALSFLLLWPLARRDVNTRRWFLLSEFGLIVILYVLSCRFLCRNRFLALIGLMAASFAVIYCIRLLDS